MAVPQTQSRILNLPYDVRHIMYTHLFPPGEQIYIQAFQNSTHAISPPEGIPVHISLVCRQLSEEAGEYLYNSYLFNIVGTKPHCIATYRSFLRILEKYARHGVRLDAFSNGDHSATMCVSLQAGEAKVPLLMARRRGEARAIEELARECAQERRLEMFDGFAVGMLLCSVLFALVAWLLSRSGCNTSAIRSLLLG